MWVEVSSGEPIKITNKVPGPPRPGTAVTVWQHHWAADLRAADLVEDVPCWHHESMFAERYSPDHTADIRQRLKDMAARGTVGLGIAAAAAGVIAVLATSGGGGTTAALIRVVWIADAALGGISAITLLVAAAGWMIYSRRRADLDTQRAEILGEFKAQAATRPRDDR